MKYKNKIVCILVAAILLISTLLPVGAVKITADAPELTAKAAMLIELNSGEILFEKDADAKIYPASLTKIMTCLVTLENCTLGETVTVSPTAMDGLGEFSSTAGLFAGEMMTMENLLYCMMISSASRTEEMR